MDSIGGSLIQSSFGNNTLAGQLGAGAYDLAGLAGILTNITKVGRLAPVKGPAAFADEAATIMENAAPSRGLNPNTGILNMARKLDIKAINRIVEQVGLTKAQRRLLHDEITKQVYSLEEIREISEQIKKLYPNK